MQERLGRHLAVQLADNAGSVSCVIALIVNPEAGGDIARQPVQADISQQEVLAVRHLAVTAPSV